MADQKLSVLKGKLHIFFEQGLESLKWSFHQNHKKGYDGLHVLKNGDILIVFNDKARKEEIWRGVVSLETRSHKSRVFNGFDQVVKDVGTVDGLQEGLNVNKWAAMFLEKKPAVLIPGPKIS